jgi:hypothetical protein
MARAKIIYEPSFNPVGHEYHAPDGRRLDSVTQILKAELGLWKYGTCEAAERGTRVHLACQLYDENRLDNSTVSEIDRPYLDSYIKAKRELKIRVYQNEIRRYHHIYLFAGTLDKIGDIDGVPVIIDAKTGEKSISYKWQTAAYLKLVEREVPKGTKRVCLYLSQDGYKLDWHDGATDWTEFLSLYAAHNVKKNYGYWKPEKTGDGNV